MSDRESGADARPGAGDDRKWVESQVLWMRYWTPALLSFRIARHSGYRFTPGQYARLGLRAPVPGDNGAVWRPFSLASAPYDDHLEFFGVLVRDGEFSALLEKLKAGDTMMIEKLAYGFLTVDQLAPGKDLWLLATGTGLGPFVSILHDPGNWQRFEHLIVVHSVRHSSELAYRADIETIAQQRSLSGAKAHLHYIPVVTREPGATAFTEHIPQLLADGRLEMAVGRPFEVANSRVMACGNPAMTRELRELLTARGFQTTRRGVRGQMAFEKYW